MKKIRKGTTRTGEKERRPQCGECECIKLKMGRSDLDKLELAHPKRPEAASRHKMIKGRPYFDKLGLAFYLKNP